MNTGLKALRRLCAPPNRGASSASLLLSLLASLGTSRVRQAVKEKNIAYPDDANILAVAHCALVAMARNGVPIASLEAPHAAILPSRRGGPRVYKRKAKNATAVTQQNEPKGEKSNEKDIGLDLSADLNFTEDGTP